MLKTRFIKAFECKLLTLSTEFSTFSHFLTLYKMYNNIDIQIHISYIVLYVTAKILGEICRKNEKFDESDIVCL